MPNSCLLIDTANCTVETCPLSCAQVDYLPTLAGNAVYAAAFGLLLLAQLALGIKYKTWGFMVGMICGLLLEVVGYVGRIMLHNNPFDFNNFIIYLVPLTIGPAFLTGALYLCLSRIIIVYGQHISRFSPRTYAITFMSSDFISLVLQGAGGGLAATANDAAGSNAGRGIMVAGVVFQVVSLCVFGALGLEFAIRLRRTNDRVKDVRFALLRDRTLFTWFHYALGTAVVLIFVRSVYRIAELQQGFDGPIANNEVAFMVLEGPMIFLAVLAMTVLHPGIAFDGQWSSAAWSVKQSRKAAFAVSGSSSTDDFYLQQRSSR
ncbi:RTA-like protein [Niveomyces insectorum RCEF 264]|uniref:RTA-like protein n=1 Tax=Niveomyces insectorum RCEF 264 TaxID=1081102 RepID=A0A167SE18_9HYPO|nr:RTA-like protein [Niveomyces insectorum RCEF 264]